MIKNYVDFYLRNLFKFSRKNYSPKDYKNPENGYVKVVLDEVLELEFKNELKILDIGAKNWSYIEALHGFFAEKCSEFQIDGIELDAYRLNSRGFSRVEVAKFYCRNFKNTNYIAGDFLEHNKKYDVITWFLPFVFYNPHKRWGLPKKHFLPEKMLKHAISSLNDGGIMLVVNQGKQEFEEQKKLYDQAGVKFIEYGEFSIENSPYKHKRFVSLVQN